jgi:hypothetical protein
MFCQTYLGESNIKHHPLGNVTQVKYLTKVCGSSSFENAHKQRVNLGKSYKAQQEDYQPSHTIECIPDTQIVGVSSETFYFTSNI